MNIRRNDGGFFAPTVLATSPAALAGLQKGNVVLAIEAGRTGTD
jgi:S1-C subfamily serine protease